MKWLKRFDTYLKQPALRALFIITLLLIVSLACNAPVARLWGGDQSQGIPPTKPTQGADQKGPGNGEKPAGDSTTESLEKPTFTPSPTPPPILTSTPTPTPYVYVSGNTNCRFGPADVYDLIHVYLTGDEALLLGKNAGETYWYTKHLQEEDLDCWLWGKYATPVGDTKSLPIFTPPPTPTPSLDFSLVYEGSDCGAGSCWLWLKIVNTGGITIESAKTFAKNTVTNDQATFKTNVFQTGVMGSDINKINPGITAYTHSGQLPNPSGNQVNVTVTACSKDGQIGVCLSKSIAITP